MLPEKKENNGYQTDCVGFREAWEQDTRMSVRLRVVGRVQGIT